MTKCDCTAVRRFARCYLLVVALAATLSLPAAETGDFDGDGRLSIADVVWRLDLREEAVGSRDGFAGYPCFLQYDAAATKSTEAGLTYIESLRRSVPDPLPHWVPLFGVGDMNSQPPLPLDTRVSVGLDAMEAPGGTDDRFNLRVRLHTSVRLRAFSILIENEDELLRVPYVSHQSIAAPGSWVQMQLLERDNAFSFLDSRLGASHAAFLITNGRYVIEWGFFNEFAPEPKVIEPGDYSIELPVRLPKGAAAGVYKVRMLERSEVLLEDYTPASPQVGPPAELNVQNTVTVGWDEGVPPLIVDPETKRVLGQVEFRLVNAGGDVPGDNEPVVEGGPGDEVSLRVQVRTEVPLSALSFRLQWSSDSLRCAAYDSEAVELLFTDPEDGVLYLPNDRIGEAGNPWIDCDKGDQVGFGVLGPTHTAGFSLFGDRGVGSPWHYGRPLEYFKLLNEWRDLTEVRLHINGCAVPGDEIPLNFRPFSVTDTVSKPGASFGPYTGEFYCRGGHTTLHWSYDIKYHDGFIKVTEGEGRCPDEDVADPGVRILLGNVAGSPGQRVEVPVFASADVPINTIRLGLESDPPEAQVESFEADFKSRLTGRVTPKEAPRGGGAIFQECDAVCAYGIPGVFRFSGDTEQRLTAILIDNVPSDGFDQQEPLADYPGNSLVEIGRLRVTIPLDFTGSEVRLTRATVPVPIGPFTLTVETGSVLSDEFFPAKEFREGVIRVVPPGKDFLRGDANLDRAVDLSDAVATLTFLFLGGGTLACEDTADADDNGEIEITDPIFLLGVLFLGNGSIPPPSPGCGADPEPDGLGCERESCG